MVTPGRYGFRTRNRRAYTLIEVAVATFLMATAVLVFAALYPSAAYSSRMSGNHTQAISAVQHKIDQMRAIGYGRLNYFDLRAAGVIDATPNAQPYRFDAIDTLADVLPRPTGTITITDVATDIRRVTIRVQWQGAPTKAMGGNHEVTALITNE